MFIGCFFADLLAHPTHFGHWWTEARTALLHVITLSPAGKKLEEYLGGYFQIVERLNMRW